MEGAFTHMGNHLVSDSAATINAGAGDDESILDGDLARGGLGRRRVADDDEYEDDDMESLASMPVGGPNGAAGLRAEEPEVELPAHACTLSQSGLPKSRALLTGGFLHRRILRHPQCRQCCQVSGLQQVVL